MARSLTGAAGLCRILKASSGSLGSMISPRSNWRRISSWGGSPVRCIVSSTCSACWLRSDLCSASAMKYSYSWRLGGRALSRNESLRTTLGARRDHLRRAEASATRVLERRRQGEAIDLVAATAIGKFGWDLRLPILDMLGLVDAHIAHSPTRHPSKPVMWLAGHVRTDADYVFARRPDYIFLQRAWSTPLRLPVHDDFWSHPALERDYEWDADMLAYRRRR
mgnify:CR=1 FL=1